MGIIYHDPELPPPPPPPDPPLEPPPPPLLPEEEGAVRDELIDDPMLCTRIGVVIARAGSGTLAPSMARLHASASSSATAQPLYSRSRSCSHAHSTCLPSLAARKRRKASVRNASAEPVALR